MIIPVPIERVPEVWPLVGSDLHSAAAFAGNHDVDVFSHAVNGNCQVWLLTKDGEYTGVVTTRIFRNMGVCRIELGAGEYLPAFADFAVQIEEWAKAQGCRRMECTGRKGWLKVLPDYKVKALVMEKELVRDI